MCTNRFHRRGAVLIRTQIDPVLWSELEERRYHVCYHFGSRAGPHARVWLVPDTRGFAGR